MQFKVPQNIDMQDKIVGPLTMSQFFYLLIGGVFIYWLFNTLVPRGLFLLFLVIALPAGLFSLALAFVKIQDRPMISFVLALIRYMSLPRIRVWHHIEPTKTKTAPAPTKKIDKTPPKKQLDSVQVKELSAILDQTENRK